MEKWELAEIPIKEKEQKQTEISLGLCFSSTFWFLPFKLLRKFYLVGTNIIALIVFCPFSQLKTYRHHVHENVTHQG